jgi:hypothetical protein
MLNSPISANGCVGLMRQAKWSRVVPKLNSFTDSPYYCLYSLTALPHHCPFAITVLPRPEIFPYLLPPHLQLTTFTTPTTFTTTLLLLLPTPSPLHSNHCLHLSPFIPHTTLTSSPAAMSSNGNIIPGVGVGHGRGLMGSRAVPARHRRHQQDNIRGVSKFLTSRVAMLWRKVRRN